MTQGKDRIRVQIEGKAFSVVGGTFQEMLAAVKQINGRRFVSELKVWQLPGIVDDIQRQLDVSGYYLEGGAPVSPAPSTGQPLSTRSGDDRIRVLVGGHRLAVVGGSFQEMLAAVKGLPGRRFDTEAKIWEIPGDPGVIKGMVEAAGFQLEGAENIPVTPVAPMEPPDLQTASTLVAPPPFEYPDFGPAEEEYPYEPPDWFDDTLPIEDSNFGEEAPNFERELPPARSQSPEPSFGPAASAASADRGDLIRIQWGDMALAVTGGSFQEMLAVVKTIPGRRFDPAEKVWQIPDDVTLDSVQQVVKAAGFVVVPEES